MITRKGRELATTIYPAFDRSSAYTMGLTYTCSLIARNATTHHAYAEVLCNGGDDRASDEVRNWQITCAEQKTERIERRIRQLVESIPDTDAGPISVVFSGDPRGCTVKLVMPGPYASLHNDWGHEGVCVPQGQ